MKKKIKLMEREDLQALVNQLNKEIWLAHQKIDIISNALEKLLESQNNYEASEELEYELTSQESYVYFDGSELKHKYR